MQLMARFRNSRYMFGEFLFSLLLMSGPELAYGARLTSKLTPAKSNAHRASSEQDVIKHCIEESSFVDWKFRV